MLFILDCTVNLKEWDNRFSSPVFLPANVAGNVKCDYTIKAEQDVKEGGKIGLSFESLDLKKGTMNITSDGKTVTYKGGWDLLMFLLSFFLFDLSSIVTICVSIFTLSSTSNINTSQGFLSNSMAITQALIFWGSGYESHGGLPWANNRIRVFKLFLSIEKHTPSWEASF